MMEQRSRNVQHEPAKSVIVSTGYVSAAAWFSTVRGMTFAPRSAAFDVEEAQVTRSTTRYNSRYRADSPTDCAGSYTFSGFYADEAMSHTALV